MKKIIVLILLFCGVCTAYPQITQEMYDKKVEEIANLKKQLEDAVITSNNMAATSQSVLNSFKDTINELKSNLLGLEKYKLQKNAIDAQLKQKNDSIILLKSDISEKAKQIANLWQEGNKKAKEEFDKGKAAALAEVNNAYKKPFDDLIKTSTKESVRRDLQMLGDNAEARPVLLDLEEYFSAKEQLEKKFDAVQIKNAQTQLNVIQQNSGLLGILKENIKYYQNYSNALKKTISELVDLDGKKSAVDEDSQKFKFNDIIKILSGYTYNYYGYYNYPYLSNILLEIIKRKKPNANADITDLLNKL